MADEDKDSKTEEATPRRLEEARADGQVAMSTEFVAGVMLAATVGAILVVGSGLVEAAGLLVVDGAQEAARLAVEELVVGDFTGLLRRAGASVFGPLTLLVAPVLLVGLLVGYGQIGVQLSPKAVAVKLEKLDPIGGFKKVLGPRGFMRTGLGVLKITMIAAAVGIVCWFEIPALSSIAGTDVQTCLVAIGRLLFRTTLAGLLVIIAISLIDLIYQRYQFAKDMRMSKKEIRDEHKNSEGDPHVKARIRQIQREVAMGRMMDDVPDATVVITNPTHYAVALRYVDGSDAAPTVLAKGLDEVALRIRAVAAEHDVLVVEEPPLARALHRACDIGDPVPEELFEAVAKVLAYVYRAQGAVAA
ncbi:MAG: flagellar biosynthesis protein FlhB [Planctomycetota bacterium]|jgi:flagellar biosynthetic protein FlhB